MRSAIAVYALLSALWLTAGAVSASTVGLNSTIEVTITKNRFVPTSVSVRDGDTIKICNSDTKFYMPYSLNKGNRFGNRPGQHIKLAPGACTTQVVHNRTGGPIQMQIFDTINAGPMLRVTIAPQRGVAADKPPSAVGGLTGTWKGTGPGGSSTYDIKQIGDEITWTGRSDDGRSWAHAFTGSLQPNGIIAGTFQDKPGYRYFSHGSVNVQVVDQCHLTFVSATVPFQLGTSSWTRVGC